MMGAEGHRRLMGNDIACIFYQEETPFEVTCVDKLGTVPQIFFVVRPEKVNNKTGYRFATINRVNVKSYGPELPKDLLFDNSNFKDFLLTKRM